MLIGKWPHILVLSKGENRGYGDCFNFCTDVCNMCIQLDGHNPEHKTYAI